MTARAELEALYSEWRHWTLRETEAIQAAQWSRVEQCQMAKAELQPRIAIAAEQVQSQPSPPGVAGAPEESLFRSTVNELIDLERRNLELIARKRQRAEGELQRLGRASQNLRRLHRSYAPDQGRSTHWQSFS